MMQLRAFIPLLLLGAAACGDAAVLDAEDPAAAASSQGQALGGCPAVPAIPTSGGDYAGIKAWKAAVTKIVDCLRINNVSTSIASTVLKEIEQKQDALEQKVEAQLKAGLYQLEAKKKAFAADLRAKIKAMGLKKRGPVIVELAESREKLTALTKLIDKYEGLMQVAQSHYLAVAKEFQDYRSSEKPVYDELVGLSERASSTESWSSLAELQQRLVEISQEETLAPQNVVIQAEWLMRYLEVHVAAFDAEIALLRPFLTKHKLKEPDVAGAGAIASLKSVVAYCEARNIRVGKAIGKLLRGIDERSRALAVVKAEVEIREAAATALHLASSAEFMAYANERIVETMSNPPKSPTLNLYLFADKYTQYVAFLQLETLCTATAGAAWLGDGCKLMAPKLATVKKLVSSTVPYMIKTKLSLLQSKGVNPALITRIQTELTAGDLGAAVLDYDLAVKLAEQLQGVTP